MKKLLVTGAVLATAYGVIVFGGLSLLSALREIDDTYFYE